MKRIAAAAFAALLLAPALAAGDVPSPAIVIDKPGTKCIAPPEVMRRTHMDLLKHQRDRTLRLGERGAKVDLNACISCHASSKTGSVIGSDQNFCQSCHSYAAVKLDCFDCHQSAPKNSITSLLGVKK